MISIICAVGTNLGIGLENKLLWKLPGDLRHFKEVTINNTVVMGQTTFESIGRVLPGRKNIILSLDTNYKVEDCIVYNSLDEVLEEYKDSEEEVFIIGGASVYKQFIKHANKLYLTLVNDTPEADTFFPDYSDFSHIVSESEIMEENGIKYKFVELTK